MFERLHNKSVTAGVAALLTALGVGGVAIAQNKASSPTPSSAAPSTAAPANPAEPADTPDTPGAADKETNDANDPADSAKEQPDSATESASEQPGDDGPGGHADEAARNAGATTQAEGRQ